MHMYVLQTHSLLHTLYTKLMEGPTQHEIGPTHNDRSFPCFRKRSVCSRCHDANSACPQLPSHTHSLAHNTASHDHPVTSAFPLLLCAVMMHSPSYLPLPRTQLRSDPSRLAHWHHHRLESVSALKISMFHPFLFIILSSPLWPHTHPTSAGLPDQLSKWDTDQLFTIYHATAITMIAFVTAGALTYLPHCRLPYGIMMPAMHSHTTPKTTPTAPLPNMPCYTRRCPVPAQYPRLQSGLGVSLNRALEDMQGMIVTQAIGITGLVDRWTVATGAVHNESS
jgi:hypothetical protein